MGPIGSPLAKIGVQLTDSNYVLLCMRIMTRVNPKVWEILEENPEFVKCVHSMGCPRPWRSEYHNQFGGHDIAVSAESFCFKHKTHR